MIFFHIFQVFLPTKYGQKLCSYQKMRYVLKQIWVFLQTPPPPLSLKKNRWQEFLAYFSDDFETKNRKLIFFFCKNVRKIFDFFFSQHFFFQNIFFDGGIARVHPPRWLRPWNPHAFGFRTPVGTC